MLWNIILCSGVSYPIEVHQSSGFNLITSPSVVANADRSLPEQTPTITPTTTNP